MTVEDIELTKENECPCCLAQIKSIVFVPCGHIFCVRCVHRLVTCGLFRACEDKKNNNLLITI